MAGSAVGMVGLGEAALPFAGGAFGPSAADLGGAAALATMLRPVVGMVEAMALADRLLARFGSLTALVAASPAQLGLEPGLPQPVRELLLACGPFMGALLQERLRPRGIARQREELLSYVAAMRRLWGPGLRALLLDGGNALLADLPLAQADGPGESGVARALLRVVCEVEPEAVALVRAAARDPSGLAPNELASVDGIGRMLAHLDVVLHDYLVAGPGAVLSARDRRLL